MESILLGVITALVSVITAIVALLKWYLPQHDRRLHNPHLEALISIQAIMAEHGDEARKRHNELLRVLDEINRKVSK